MKGLGLGINKLKFKAAGEAAVNPFLNVSVYYGFRNIGIANVTNVIRVQRSNDNAQQDFTEEQVLQGSGVVGSVLNFVGANDGFIIRFYDPYAVSDLIQNDTAQCFKIVESGVLNVDDDGIPYGSADGNSKMQSTYDGTNLVSYFLTYEQTNINARSFTTDNSSSGLRIKSGNELTARGTTDVEVVFDGANTLGRITFSGIGTTSFIGYINGIQKRTGNIGAYQPGNFTIGGGVNNMVGKFYEFIGFNVDATSVKNDVQLNINNHLNSITQDTNPQMNLVFDGNSLTEGFGAGLGQVYPNFIKDDLNPVIRNLQFNSFGDSGQTLQEMLADISTQILPLPNPIYDNNVIIIWEDINSIINTGRTAEQNLADFENYFSQCKSAGYTKTILLTGFYPRQLIGGGYNTANYSATRLQEQKDFFDLCQLGVANCDLVLDLRNLANVGGLIEGATLDPVYFVDSVHLTAAGYQEVADYVFANAFNDILI